MACEFPERYEQLDTLPAQALLRRELHAAQRRPGHVAGSLCTARPVRY
jgi:hypothetical protein